MDQSSALSSAEFEQQILFFQTLASKIYVGVNDSHIAVVTTAISGSWSGNIVSNLTTYNSSGYIAYKLGQETLQYGSSSYQFSNALPLAFDTLELEQRVSAEAVIVAVTKDAMIYSGSSVSTYMDSARANGTKVITLSMGMAQATNAVTDPSYHFHANNASQLLDFIPSVLNILCPCKLLKVTLKSFLFSFSSEFMNKSITIEI